MKTKAICILGMHRSGTSVITRAINFLGAYLGEEKDMISPAPDNPEGFWERADVVALHDRILAEFNRSPDSVSPLPTNWFASDKIRHFKEELCGLIKQYFLTHSLWAWKDPRTCLLIDLWKDVLIELDIELSCVFVFRNPIDVAYSLRKRNDLPFDKSFGFWFNHNISALDSISNITRVFVNYDKFVENWEIELRRCAASIGIEWPEDSARLMKNMHSFLKPELQHHKSSIEDLSVAPLAVKELYELLLCKSNSIIMSDIEFNKDIVRLHKMFYDIASFFRHDMDNLFFREKRLFELDKQLETSNDKICF